MTVWSVYFYQLLIYTLNNRIDFQMKVSYLMGLWREPHHRRRVLSLAAKETIKMSIWCLPYRVRTLASRSTFLFYLFCIVLTDLLPPPLKAIFIRWTLLCLGSKNKTFSRSETFVRCLVSVLIVSWVVLFFSRTFILSIAASVFERNTFFSHFS